MHKVGFIIILSVTKLIRIVIMVMEYAHNTISVGFLIRYRFFGSTLSTLGEHTLKLERGELTKNEKKTYVFFSSDDISKSI